MIQIIILILYAALEMSAQVKIPNGDFNKFRIIKTKNHNYNLPVSWKEHQKNKTQRKDDGHGFAYKYNLPDANDNALALHRTYSVQTNGIFTSFLVSENKENLRLVGRYKFSGSDIDVTKDSLRISVFSSKNKINTIPETLQKNTETLDITVPKAQFEWFHLDVNQIQKNKYLTIVIQIITGSDDNYYWGESNAVLDDLKFVTIKKISQKD